ncbi:DUF6093 family protein [Nesterenkonia populi]|uniref:DUF6093 family protein n=1 Tax=Nesterenkonia populi TaxID=1591087 RepID=UPI0011BD65D2|nr:DUF6093 family protein [Nesterenkonia populi]
MVATRLLARGRQAAETLMVDTCEITRYTGELATDPETGIDYPVGTIVYSGPCKVSSTPDTAESYGEGSHRVIVEAPRLHLPVDAEVQPGDEAVITSAAQAEYHTGDRMRLRSLNRGTWRTAQRWNVEIPTGQ